MPSPIWKGGAVPLSQFLLTIRLGVNNYCLSINIDMMREITKIGLAVIDGDRLLLVRKRGAEFYILPGGKPEGGETDAETLSRELEEELGCGVLSDRLTFLGIFTDTAAGMPGVKVTVRLYSGLLIGTPSPRAEIEQLLWWQRSNHRASCLAPSLRNSILPFLCHQDVAGIAEQKPASFL
jgi:8-oxo-dGTP diphosphatase